MAPKKLQKSYEGLILLPSLGGGGAEKAGLDLFYEFGSGFKLVLLEDVRDYQPSSREEDVITLSSAKGSALAKLMAVPFQTYRLAKLARSLGVKSILSFTEEANIVNILSGYLYRHVIVLAEQCQPELQYGHKGLMGKVVMAVSRFFYRKADRVIAVTEGVKTSLMNSYGVPPEKIPVILNPIRLSPGVTVHEETKLPKRFILHVGRVTFPHKAQDRLLEAFQKIAHRFPEISLAFVGVGPDLDPLRMLVEKSGFKDRVFLLGWRSDVSALYGKAEFLVLCSHFEAMGNVIIEAMASNCAVLAADVPCGPREVLGSSVHGLLVPDNSADALADGMITLLQNPQLKESLRKSGMSRSEDFRPSVIAAQFLKVIRTCT